MLTTGYVHVGASTHGVSRYGRMLAAAVAQRPDVRVLESDLALARDDRSIHERIADSAARLAGADLIHLQFNNLATGCVWGAGWHQLEHLRSFVQTASVPFVVTVHDIYRSDRTWSTALRHPFREVRRTWRARPRTVTLRWLRRRAARVFVCSREERARISAHDPGICVIPHFVEPHALERHREEAKAALGLAGHTVVTLLGYIHERKGHGLLIKALSELGDDVVAVFAGAPPRTDDNIVAQLLSLAKSRGLEKRLRITGYLPDDQLDLYLTATDVAVCPFKRLSASGSMSTWISTGRPIVASNLPQVAEYNTFEPDAIITFDPYTEEALAASIRTALARNPAEQRQRVARLEAQLALPVIAGRHVDAYREVIAARSSDR